MHYEEDLQRQGVLELLLLKKRLKEAGDPAHEDIKIILFVLAGTMRGVFGAGQILALVAAGITADHFEAVVGVSTGAVAAACYVAGQHWIVPALYRGFCLTDGFISKAPGRQINIRAIADFLRGKEGHEPLNLEAIRKSSARLLIGVTNADTGAGELVDGQKASDNIIEAILRSTAVPGLVRDSPINGFYDGAGGTPFPVEKVLELYPSRFITGILTFANRALPTAEEQGETARAWRVLTHRLGENVRRAFMTSEGRFNTNLAYLRTLGIPYGIVWTDPFDALERDSGRVLTALVETENHMTGLLENARLLVV